MNVICNGYIYSTDEENITEKEALQQAAELDDFLKDVREWSDDELEEIHTRIQKEGLTKGIRTAVYDAYLDMCCYGNKKETEFLCRLGISKDQLAQVLV